ncbi:hypothetical protein PT015_21320 [Candidatus Mycobacterium wuenschmannii]|uniref:Uncharacterized protein n=1 Tax=Candidatus Mycobacterium wuenschmannii TaxID=3027808 RepID=A0ABY8VWG6_9MYCO|nr:hypothetical protein [Candidatus Mycobacterium wuenschmannii]WIM87355.1 hypothetical protein PT015_21320 [Candidatus Mycobacterium wuenschmannii]
MTYPSVGDLPEEATSTLLGVCGQLSRSKHAGLARWAAAVSDALLVQLVTVTTGVHVDGTTHEPLPLKELAAAELEGLHSLLLAGAEASEDESVAAWCTRMNGLIIADLCRRELEQLAIDAKAAAIVAEERRLACLTRHDGLFA